MNVIEAKLTDEEKRKLRSVLILRGIIFLVFIAPILYAFFYIFHDAITSLLKGSPDLFSLIFTGALLLVFIWGRNFIVPFYINSFQYGKARCKSIIETTILEIDHPWDIRLKQHVTIMKTDYGDIRTDKQVILFRDVNYIELRRGMKLYLHVIPGTKKEFLRISAHRN